MTTKHTGILMELQYLAPIQYYSKFILYPTIWIEQWEHYRKGSFRNRFHVGTAQGPLALSIPLLKGKNEQMPITEVQIANRVPWQKIHWRSIRTAYGKAPFFEFYAAELIKFYQKRYDFLFSFSWQLQTFVLEALGLTTKVQKTEEYYEQLPDQQLDFRNKIRPKTYNVPQDPLFQPYPYTQLFEEKQGFLVNLSILDLVFCTGPEARNYLERSIAL